MIVSRVVRVLCAGMSLCALQSACVPESLTLSPPEVGTLIGEVFVADPIKRSVSGAIIEVYGTSARAVSEEGKRFVLGNVPIGTRTVSIEHPETGRVTRFDVDFTQAYQTLTLTEDQTTLGRSATLRGTVTGPGAARAGLAGVTVYLVGGNSRQLTTSGGDGGFVLENLPAGPVEIGYAYPGYDVIITTLALAEGDNTAGETLVGAKSGTRVTFTGSVKLTDKQEHGGTIVSLNRGFDVVITDGSGKFEFVDVPAGLYSLRAEHPGYRSTELPLVTVDASANVRGLSQMYLSPGSDAQVSDQNVDFRLAIASPLANEQYELGEALTLVANVTHSQEIVPNSRIRWTTAPLGGGAATILASGNPVSTSALGLGVQVITASVADGDGRLRQAQTVVEIVPVNVAVAITSQTPNAQLVADLPTVFSADVTVRAGLTVPASAVVWSFRAHGTSDAPTPLGTGATLVAELPSFVMETIVDVMCDVAVAGALGSASVTVSVKPLRPEPIVPQAFSAYVPPPVPTLVLDPVSGAVTRVDYTVSRTQPAILRATTDSAIASGVSWTSNTGVAFSGADADLSVLPVGTHDFTVTVPGAQGQTGQSLVRVIVQPFAFTLAVTEPMLSPPQPYYLSAGLPFAVSITHSFQTAFSPTSVKWFSAQGQQIGIGTQGRTFQLPAGPGTLRIEATDAAGNVAIVQAPYTLQQVTFTAAWVLPTLPASYLEGTTVQAVISYAHSLVPAQIPVANLKVRYYSSIQGLLSVGATNEFQVGDQPIFSGLVPGVHDLTARIFDGTSYAEATIPVTIRSPGVSAVLNTPASDKIFFSGDALNFSVTTTADNSAVVQRTWYLDGLEFDAGWDDYGPAGPTGSGRDSINLGTYPAGPAFADSRWAPGTHTVKYFARLANVDPLLGCVTIPNQAVCITIAVNLAKPGLIGATGPSGPGDDVCATGATQNITGANPLTLSGIKRIDCDINVNAGGTFTIAQGSGVVIKGSRTITLNTGGTLSVGSPGQSSAVIITAQTTATNAWNGLNLYATSGASATFNNVTVRNASNGLRANDLWAAGGNTLSADRMTFEYNANGVFDYCLPNVTNFTFRDCTTGISEWWGCGTPRVYDGFSFERVTTGLRARDGTLTVQNSTFTAVGGSAIDTQNTPVSLTVKNCVFDQGPVTDADNIAIDFNTNTCPELRVETSVFRNFNTGILHQSCSKVLAVPRLTVLGSVFDKNVTAINDTTGSLTPAEVHLNSFLNTSPGIDLRLAGKSADMEAQGNYLGPTTVVTTAAGALAALSTGVVSDLPRIYDYFDGGTDGLGLPIVDRVARVSNVLQASFSDPAQHPVAYIREPQRTHAYNSNRCIPLVYDAPLGEVGACRWFIDSDPQPLPAPGASVDGADCYVGALSDGPHRAVLECAKVDGVGTPIRYDVHDTTFLVKNDTFSGPQRRSTEHWSGTVVVDGDIIVPAGKTLIIDPGTTVRFASNDRLRHGISLDFTPEGVNDYWGWRNLVDVYVKGTLQANGLPGSRIRLESTSQLPLESQWGNVAVDAGGVLSVSYADVSGAAYFAHGRYENNVPLNAPQISLSQLSFDGVRVVSRGVCPLTFSNVTGEDIGLYVMDAYCPNNFTMQGSYFERIGDIGGSNPLLTVRTYASGGPANVSFSLAQTTIDRGYAGRNGTGINIPSPNDFSSVSLTGSTLKDLARAITYNGSGGVESLTVSDSTFVNFTYLLTNTGVVDLFTADHNHIESGQYFFYTSDAPKNISMTRNRVIGVTTPFFGMSLGNYPQTLLVVGNQFSAYTTVFGLGVTGSGTLTADLHGNNYLGAIATKASVLDLNEISISGCPVTGYCTGGGTLVAQLDMSGSHFGNNAGNTAPKTDDEIRVVLGWEGTAPTFTTPPAGRQVDFSSKSDTALVLDLPP